MKPTALIVQENNSETRNLTELLLESNVFSCVEAAFDGQKALEIIHKKHIDFLITDLILPIIDGFSLIKQCLQLNEPPKIYILTAINVGKIISEAFSLGVEYCFIKPIEPCLILSRIKESHLFSDKTQENISISSSNQNNSSLEALESNSVLPQNSTSFYDEGSFRYQNRSLDERISSIFMNIGIPAHIKGYKFLRTGIELAVESPQIINNITKMLYPSIAEIYDTTASKVERAIRHAIEVAWNKGKIENLNSLFGIKVYSPNEKPTNGEFIALIADKLLLEGNHTRKKLRKTTDIDKEATTISPKQPDFSESFLV